jgi:hypothetical protein
VVHQNREEKKNAPGPFDLALRRGAIVKKKEKILKKIRIKKKYSGIFLRSD